MARIRRCVAGLILAVAIVGGTSAAALARVVYQNGSNVIKSTEYVFVKYEGSAQIRGTVYYNNRTQYTVRAGIKYSRGGSIIAGWAYTGCAKSQNDAALYTTSLGAWDSLNPNAPKTLFNYTIQTASRAIR